MLSLRHQPKGRVRKMAEATAKGARVQARAKTGTLRPGSATCSDGLICYWTGTEFYGDEREFRLRNGRNCLSPAASIASLPVNRGIAVANDCGVHHTFGPCKSVRPVTRSRI